MGLLDELKKALGLDEEAPADESPAPFGALSVPPPERRAMSAAYVDDENHVRPADSLEGAKAMAEAADRTGRPPLMGPPPKPNFSAGYVDEHNQVRPADSLEGARALAEAAGRSGRDRTLLTKDLAENEGMSEDQANSLRSRIGLERDDSSSSRTADDASDDDSHLNVSVGDIKEVPQKVDLQLGKITRGGNVPSNEPGQASGGALGAASAHDILARAKAALVAKRGAAGGGSDPGRAALLAAIAKTGKPPDSQESPPDATAAASPPGDVPPPPAYRDPSEPGEGVRGLMSRLAMGATPDPRTERLKAALEKSAHMKELSRRIHEMGRSADIDQEHATHGDAGKGLSDAADEAVNAELLPTKFEQGNQKFEDDRKHAAQDFDLKNKAEGRAEQGELRAAGADRRAAGKDVREQTGFDTAQSDNDPKSRQSANLRSAAESMYPSVWHRIPEEIRNNYSATDVQRIFKELQMKDFMAKDAGAKGGRLQEQFDDRQLVDFEKNLVAPGTVDAYKRIAGRIEDPAPIWGMSTGSKVLQQSLNVVPLVGGKLAERAGNMLRGMTPEGQALQQDAIRVMQQITLDTTGKAMNEQELENIKTRLGMTVGDDNAFKDALRKELMAAKEKAERALSSRNPRVQKMARERGIMPDWTPRAGGAVRYARDAEGQGE